MRLATLYFTESGKKISQTLKRELDHRIDEFGKDTVDGKIRDEMEELFKSYDGIIFISSTGIAVRFIAPYIESKTQDPAVVVVDDMAKFTISLLSGHIGGANELSLEISSVLKNMPVVTTASDNRGIDAVDVFAMRNGLEIDDLEQAKLVTSLMVEGKTIRILSNHTTDLSYLNTVSDGQMDYDGTLALAPFSGKIDTDKPFCILRPSILNIGIGCRRGKGRDEILDFIETIFKKHNLYLSSILKVGTVDVKSDEEGIIELSKQLKSELVIFSKDEIECVQDMFSGSEFVRSQIGVSSVCEPSAYLLGESLVIEKQSLNGITIAVSKGKRQ